MKVIYEPVKFELKNQDKLIKLVNKYSDSFIAITAQYKHLLKKFNSKHKGVVLGCDIKKAKNFKGKTILFVGDGVFHALMLKIKHKDKKIIAINPFNMKKKIITNDLIKKFIFRQAIAKDKLERAKNVGIIISTKPGQCKTKEAIKLKKQLEKQDKSVYLFIAETINPDEFMNFKKLDILINTACPRLALDDYTKFPIPIINWQNL